MEQYELFVRATIFVDQSNNFAKLCISFPHMHPVRLDTKLIKHHLAAVAKKHIMKLEIGPFLSFWFLLQKGTYHGA